MELVRLEILAIRTQHVLPFEDKGVTYEFAPVTILKFEHELYPRNFRWSDQTGRNWIFG